MLKPEGFTRKGRFFFRYSTEGDAVSLQIRTIPGEMCFFAIFGIVPAVDISYRRSRGDSDVQSLYADNAGLFSKRLHVPGRIGVGADRWGFDAEDDRSIQECGEILGRTVEAEVLPIFELVSTRQGVLEFLGSLPPTQRGKWRASSREAALSKFRMDTAPPAEVLVEVEERISREGYPGPYQRWARKYLTARLEAEHA
ncbi:MAG TPA: hypothetical protein VMB79_11420 [Jatrophihabitans sp.]|nr:hypothetical protein [Jatrophihabitans sp.]